MKRDRRFRWTFGWIILGTVFITASFMQPIERSAYAPSSAPLADSTPGEVSFTVKTLTYNGDRSPKHILAIWVENASSTFVKTKLRRAETRVQWLITWNNVSSGNVTDATTGATLNSHTTHNVVWNCTDVNGDVVPDGDYTFYVEFTEEHSQGPMTSVTFTKGPNSQTVTPADKTNFVDVELAYTPLVSSTPSMDYPTTQISAYPNPFSNQTTISFGLDAPGMAVLKIYSLNGQLVKTMKSEFRVPESASFTWNGTDNQQNKLPAGTYVYEIQAGKQRFTGRAMLLGR
jgi:flagellar hook assembly protein FlgD